METKPTPDAAAENGAKLGTFAGVFTPSVLTILGIILFLRLGFVVGSAGLVNALAIVLVANLISVLTSVSLSAIATNLRVKGGGDYYLISRTLGVQFGGALGLVLFLAQSVSIAFYAIGFGEAVARSIGIEHRFVVQGIAAAAVALLFVLAWLGSDWATRFQYVVMTVLFSAIVAFYFGGFSAWSWSRLSENVTPAGDLPFWAVFAIFFPAVTGFTQGVSMSGDLRDPGRSLPWGTFAAVGLSMVIYVSVAVVLAAAVPGSELVADYGAMRNVSAVSWLVAAGVIAATLSSALASYLGAPRILQSLASDRVFKLLDPFAKGHGPASNPRRGVLLSTVIAFATIAMGQLNVIAPVVSMFFLISYGLLNYATYVEAQAASPSFRPRFRWFDKRLSLLGAVLCLGAMLAIHAVAGAVAIAVLFGLHQYIGRGRDVERWAAGDRSRRLRRIRDDLHAVRERLDHPRDWRPVLLVFSDDPGRRDRLLRFAAWIEGGSGFTTVIQLIEGEPRAVRQERDRVEEELRTQIKELEVAAFARAVMVEKIDGAVPALLQSFGLGPVRANTVLVNWFDHPQHGDEPGVREYGLHLRTALRFGLNLVILAAGEQDFTVLDHVKPAHRRIDVWYRENATGELSLMLAYLMTRSGDFSDAKIRLFVQAPQDGDREEALAALEEKLKRDRIAAEPVLVDEVTPQSIVEHSAASVAVLLPFRLKDDQVTSPFGGSLDALDFGLGITAFVLGCQDIDLDAEPEEGAHAEAARAEDAADHLEKRAKQAQAEAKKAVHEAGELEKQLEKAREEDAEPETVAKLERQLEKAREEAEKRRKRAAREQAKVEQTAGENGTVTNRPDDPKDPA
jgi:amino acid transporter